MTKTLKSSLIVGFVAATDFKGEKKNLPHLPAIRELLAANRCSRHVGFGEQAPRRSGDQFDLRWLHRIQMHLFSPGFREVKKRGEKDLREDLGSRIYKEVHFLGGGFKYFLFSTLFGEDSHFD